MTTSAVLTAAGSGTRLGRPEPKALVPLAGVPLVVRAARGLVASGVVDEIVVTAPPEHLDAFAGLLAAGVAGAAAGTGGVTGVPVPVAGPVTVRVVAGGASRQASVAAGLAAVAPSADVVLVHDAARCLTPPAVVADVVAAVRAGHRAVVPGVPLTDTVKRVGPADGGAEPVLETPDRRCLRAVQTPQGFDRALLVTAHAAGRERARREDLAASDDAGLVEALGEPVWVVPGHELALKITTAHDLARAEVLLRG